MSAVPGLPNRVNREPIFMAPVFMRRCQIFSAANKSRHALRTPDSGTFWLNFHLTSPWWAGWGRTFLYRTLRTLCGKESCTSTFPEYRYPAVRACLGIRREDLSREYCIPSLRLRSLPRGLSRRHGIRHHLQTKATTFAQGVQFWQQYSPVPECAHRSSSPLRLPLIIGPFVLTWWVQGVREAFLEAE